MVYVSSIDNLNTVYKYLVRAVVAQLAERRPTMANVMSSSLIYCSIFMGL